MKRWAVFVFAIVFAGCGGTTSPAASPSGSATASPPSNASASPILSAVPSSPPASATPGPSSPPQAVVLEKDTIAQVVTNDLLLRSAPGTGADSKKLAPLLQKPAQIYVVDGPVAKDGYDWYEVQPVEYGAPFGWVAAAGRDGEPWLGKATITCPSLPLDLATLAQIAGPPQTFLGLACLGNHPITVRARLGIPEATCGVSPGWTINPGWLGPCVAHDFLTALSGAYADPYFDAVFAPKVDLRKLPRYGIEPRTWLKVQVTGQFDHPAARTCRGVKEDTDPPSAPEIVLMCRNVFVITAIKALP